MLLYIIVILVSIAVITLGHGLFMTPMFSDPLELLFVALYLVIGTIAVIAIDGLFAVVIRRLTPEKWYLPGKKLFIVSKKETKFYKFLKIKAWKDKVPELGMFTGLSKSQLGDTNDIKYLRQFLIEINYGTIIHLVNALTGFLVILIPMPMFTSFEIWLPIFIVNFVLSIMPVFILRYTSYTLYRIYQNKLKKQEKSHN
jgi:hypothetical protein